MMHYFYKKTPTSSLDQFSKDFGEFPPQPLSSELKNNKFDVVSLSALSSKYYTISRVAKTFRRDPEGESDPIVKEMIEERRDSIAELKDSLAELKDMLSKLPFIKKMVIFLIIFASSPLLLAAIFIVSLKVLYKIAKIKPIGTESLGFFSPKTQDKSEIVIKPGLIKKSKISPEAILSHEHIHLMQYSCFRDGSCENIDSDFEVNIQKYLKDEYSGSEKVLYYLSLNEVEARLHEIVLSYYKNNRKLPIDYQGFLSILLACNSVGEHVRRILMKWDVSLPDNNSDEYSLREWVPARDILLMLTYFAESHDAKRFICEVLSVMYGNLLVIYGDSDSAFNYFSTIECRDFYDQIYGKYAAPSMRIRD